MNNPHDPYRGQPGYPPQPPQGGHPGYPPQPHGQPHGGPPGYPSQGPYPPHQAKSNNGVLIGIIVLLVLVIVTVAVLFFTGVIGGNKTSTTTPVAGPSTTVTPTPSPTPTPTPDPATGPGEVDVAARLQQAAAQMQSRLPMVNGPTTITTVTAIGTTLRMEGTIAADLSAADWAQLDAQLRPNICGGSFGEAIRLGATAETVLTDNGGESRTISVSNC